MISEKIAEIIIERISNIPVVISISGAADLGKTFISKKVVQILELQNLSVGHLTMDSYLISRTERHSKGLSGYNIESYNIKQAINNLNNFINSEEIEYSPYNHQMGRCEDNKLTIKNKKILIFEGLQVMHPNLRPFLDTTFFMYTNDDNLKELRSEADKEKRRLTEHASNNHMQSEFMHYKIEVESYKWDADYLLYLKDKWNYNLIPNKKFEYKFYSK